MEYSPTHDKFLITQKELKLFSNHIKYSMAKIRIELNVPLHPRESSGALKNIDFIEKNMIDACKAIGVDLGVDWGCDLDLSDCKR